MQKKINLILLFLFSTCFLFSKEKIGLVLSGGGAKGAYEVGVWCAMQEFGLDKQTTVISGTSVGALNAALFACVDAKTARKLWENEVGYDSFLNPDADNIEALAKVAINHIKTGAADQKEKKTAQAENEEVSKLKNALWNLEGGAKTAGKDSLEFIKDYLLHDYHTEGLFERDDLKRIIDNYVSLKKIKESGKQIYATCVRKRYLAIKAAAKKIGMDDNSHYFLLNEQINNENISCLLLASSALPLVYPSQKLDSTVLEMGQNIDGAEYVDGGFEQVGGKNIQVTPVINSADVDRIIIVYLRSKEEMKDKKGEINGIIPEKMLNGKPKIDIIPTRSLNKFHGTVDFSKDTIDELIKLGYEDAVKVFEENGYKKVNKFDIIDFFNSYLR